MVSLDTAEWGGRKGDPHGNPETSLLLINHVQLFFLLSSLHLEFLEIQVLPVCIELLLDPARLNIYKWYCVPGIWWSVKGDQWMVITKIYGKGNRHVKRSSQPSGKTVHSMFYKFQDAVFVHIWTCATIMTGQAVVMTRDVSTRSSKLVEWMQNALVTGRSSVWDSVDISLSEKLF